MNLVNSIISARAAGKTPVIAEIKRVIPRLSAKEGLPPDIREAGPLAGKYLQGGAAGISVVTEKKHFGGCPEKDVPAVLNSTPLPLLIKDFIRCTEDVDYYCSLVEGEDPAFLERTALLLHLHMAGEKAGAILRHIYSLGMKALIEIRGDEDLKGLKQLEDLTGKVELVGINNKNIEELEMGEDRLKIMPETIEAVRSDCPRSLIISQSAHGAPADAAFSLEAGADAVLVGTAFMLAQNPLLEVSSFVQY